MPRCSKMGFAVGACIAHDRWSTVVGLIFIDRISRAPFISFFLSSLLSSRASLVTERKIKMKKKRSWCHVECNKLRIITLFPSYFFALEWKMTVNSHHTLHHNIDLFLSWGVIKIKRAQCRGNFDSRWSFRVRSAHLMISPSFVSSTMT